MRAPAPLKLARKFSFILLAAAVVGCAEPGDLVGETLKKNTATVEKIVRENNPEHLEGKTIERVQTYLDEIIWPAQPEPLRNSDGVRIFDACSTSACYDLKTPDGILRLNDPTNWPTHILDKCSASACYDFKTPFGIYRLNDPAGDPKIRAHIEEGWRLSEELSKLPQPEVKNYDGRFYAKPSPEYKRLRKALSERPHLIESSINLQKLDMLRAGCVKSVDAFCKTNISGFSKIPAISNTPIIARFIYSHGNYRKVFTKAFKACGDDLNFGQTQLSDCVIRHIPPPKINPKTGKPFPSIVNLPSVQSCSFEDGEKRTPFGSLKFEGSMDERLEAIFDTRCLAWQE